MADETELLTRKLVNVRTDSGSEKYASYMIASYLEGNGAETVRIDDNMNVVASFGNSESDNALLANTHMDTVFADPAEWDTDPFTACVKNGKLYGRGAADTKGGLAAMMVALRYSAKEIDHTILFTAVVCEETPDRKRREMGTAHVIFNDSGIRNVKCAVVGEPTGLNISPGNRGREVIRIESKSNNRRVNALAHLDGLNRELYEKFNAMKQNREFPFAAGYPDLDSITLTPVFGEKSNTVPGAATRIYIADGFGSVAYAALQEKINSFNCEMMVSRPCIRKDGPLYMHSWTANNRAFLQVDAFGLPAHAAKPAEGANAIEYLDLLDHYIRDNAASLIPVEIGSASREKSMYGVPQAASRVYDSRCSSIEGSKKLRALIDSLVCKYDTQEVGVVKLLEGKRWPAMPETSEHREFVDRAYGILSGVRGFPCNPNYTSSFTTDASFIKKLMGIPLIVVGPGEENMAHKSNEFVDMEQLGLAPQIYHRLFTQLFN